MQLERTSLLAASPTVVADRMLDPDVMGFLMRPFVIVDPIDPPAFPQRWVPGRYRVKMRLFGRIPLGWQDIVVCDLVNSGERCGYRDRGSRSLARIWDHRLLVEACGDGRARYTDRLEVDAGTMTAMVWLFAQVLFWWRHRRWHALIARMPA